MNGKDADALSASFAEGRKAEREMHLQKTEELRTAVENIIQPVAVSYSKGQQAIEEILSTISALQSRLDEAVRILNSYKIVHTSDCGVGTFCCTCGADKHNGPIDLFISKAEAVKG
jgi:phosphoribosylanthranilate isomerase